MLQIEILKTELISDTLYIDFLLANGAPYTFAMEKIDAPAGDPLVNFGVKEQSPGNHFAEFVKRYKKEESSKNEV